MKITIPFVAKVLRLFGFGLPSGLGMGGEGGMCMQFVICHALGQGVTDQPSCVNDLVRSYGIWLNDCDWLSNQARANGLRRLAIAQLGTRSSDYLFDEHLFRVRAQLAMRTMFGTECMDVLKQTNDSMRTLFANQLADILAEMKTPGSEHLCMVDWSAEDLNQPFEEEVL